MYKICDFCDSIVNFNSDFRSELLRPTDKPDTKLERYQGPPTVLSNKSSSTILNGVTGTTNEFDKVMKRIVDWLAESFRRGECWESRLLWTLSGASIALSNFNYMLSFVTLMFNGHLGALELAGASIAIMLGMASAVQTVCQRVMVLHTGAAVLQTFLYWFSGDVLSSHWPIR
ncbi:hypothetical protein QQ045_027025 [Rhodiola kirilowii]